MSDFDLINFLMIRDVGRSTKNNEKLQDLRDKADYLARETGQPVAKWYEFQQSVPKEEPHTLRNILIGAVIGMALGAIGGVALAVSLAFFGGAVGAFANTENIRRQGAVDKYEAYLNTVEQSVGQSRAYSIDRMPPLVEGENVAHLRQKSGPSLQRQ